MNIINSMRIGENISVQIDDNGVNLRNGEYIADENGKQFNIVSIAMVNNKKRIADSNAELLLSGDIENIGEKLYIIKERM